MPATTPQAELVAAPGQKVPMVDIWDEYEPNKMRLKKTDQNLIPRDRLVIRPNEWAVLLVRSYTRYLCRTHGAASGEFIRYNRNGIPPGVLFMDNIPPGAFDEITSNFGEISR
jgi:hypothetical protein